MANQNTQNQLVSKIKDNYQSLILGGLVILVGISTLMKVSPDKKVEKPNEEKKVVIEVKKNGEVVKIVSATKYIVKKDDTLWLIAERNYDSGYKWSEIAKANNLSNANLIKTGQALTLPKLEMVRKPAPTGQIVVNGQKSIPPQTAKVTLNADKYTIVAGDTLWSIAVRAYGDGYAWVKIAKANGLMKHPNLIHRKNVLKLPR